ncbi:hydroxypyruvate reductase [Thermotomaculum hydrothermale]|uniref:Hydroxypyruvate reductase n=1 Tax=Thermotomaculum hydrothermale TaxID=981385 RepID=A0A7R6PWD7_9BACT|nr:DUF4147 domain-containing protein [Thermotomaculum hydrothermale]BBB31835.1 hydroxypyruvate reductase [Thermotomaculum hydrothermale]
MLKDIYLKLIEKINPEKLLTNYFARKKQTLPYKYVVAIGKAAIPMVKGFSQLFSFKKGFVVSPYDGDIPSNCELFVSTHPEISEESFKAANKLINFLENSKGNTAILLSGGGSALIEKPLDFLSLKQVSDASNFLVKSGLPIEDINFFRIHLSQIKGGGLLNFLKSNAECFILCDVLGKRIDRVSSAPFLKVKRDFKTFVEKAEKIGLFSVLGNLREEFLNTNFKVNDFNIPHSIVADNSTVVDIFSSQLEANGLKPEKYYDFIQKDVETESKRLFSLLKEFGNNEKTVIVAGGEATVKVRGRGKGGRTLELGLRFIKRMIEDKEFLPVDFLFATTDGIDGNSDSAGVFVDSRTLKTIFENETLFSIDAYLLENNSKAFFEKYNCLLKTGYTGTNLLDIYSIRKV